MLITACPTGAVTQPRGRVLRALSKPLSEDINAPGQKKLKPSASGRVALAAATCGVFGKLLFDGQLRDVSYCSSEASSVRQVLFLHMKWSRFLCLCSKCLIMWWKRLEIHHSA